MRAAIGAAIARESVRADGWLVAPASARIRLCKTRASHDTIAAHCSAQAKKLAKGGGSEANLSSLSLDEKAAAAEKADGAANGDHKDVTKYIRTVTGVLTSRPTSKDIKIDGFSMGINGVELIQDCSIELTIGRRRVPSREPAQPDLCPPARSLRARCAAEPAPLPPAHAAAWPRDPCPHNPHLKPPKPYPGPPRSYGFLGQNGCGKTNFLQCLANREVPIPPHVDLYHLREEARPPDTADPLTHPIPVSPATPTD